MKLIKFLEKTTGLNVAASTDKTGAGDGAEGGFDYVLETEGADDNTFESYFNPEILKQWEATAFIMCAAIGMSAALATVAAYEEINK